jgi:hypothetical protein
MVNVEGVVAHLQNSLIQTLGVYFRAQRSLPSTVLKAILLLEAVSLIALGSAASLTPVVAETIGVLAVLPVGNAAKAGAHGALFVIALAVVLVSAFIVVLRLIMPTPPIEGNAGLLAKIESLWSVFSRRVLLPWCLATIVSGFGCSPAGTAAAASAARSICADSGVYLFLTIVAGVFLVLWTGFSALMELVVFDIEMLSKSPTAASHGRVQMLIVILKALAAVLIGAGYPTLAPAPLALVAIVLGLLVAYLVYNRAPYLHRQANALFIGAGAATAWAGAVGLIPLISPHIGTAIPATFGTGLVFVTAGIWSHFSLSQLSDLVHVDGTGGGGALSVWHAIMWTRDRLRRAARERRLESTLGFSREARKAALSGNAILAAKPKTSVIEDLVSQAGSKEVGALSNTGVAATAAMSTSTDRVLTQAEQLEKEALLGVAYIEAEHAQNPFAQLAMSRFWGLLFTLSHFKERQSLTTAKALSSTFDVRFFVTSCMDAIRRNEGRAAVQRSGGDLFDRVRFDKAIARAWEHMSTAYESQHAVMKLVAAGSYDVSMLHNDIALGFGIAMKEAADAVEEMIIISPDSIEALSLAAEFFMNLVGDPQRAIDLRQRIGRLVEQRRRLAERKVPHVAFGAICEDISPTDEMNCIFTIATDRSRLGEITAFNEAASNTFGRRDFLGQNIASIIPQPIAAVHDRFLQRFLRTGTARLLDSTRFLLARHSDSSLFPIRFRLYETPPSDNDVRPKLTGICSPINSDEGYIIVGDHSLDFVITAACRESCSLLERSPSEIEVSRMSGTTVFPELFGHAGSVLDEDAPRPALVRGVSFVRGVAGPKSAAPGQKSVMGKSMAKSAAQRNARTVTGKQTLAGVPDWANDMPLKLQMSFGKPTRVFLFKPSHHDEPGPSPANSGPRHLLEAGTDTSAAPDSARATGEHGDDDLLTGLLDGAFGAGDGIKPVDAPVPGLKREVTTPKASRRHVERDTGAVPVNVRCYVTPRPFPSDPSAVVVCWTRRDGGGTGPASRHRTQSVSNEAMNAVNKTVVASQGIAAAAKTDQKKWEGQSRHGSEGGDGKSMSSFSSVSARKTARRKVEVLARHTSSSLMLMRTNLFVSFLIFVVAASLALYFSETVITKVQHFEHTVTSSLELTRALEITALTLHSSVSAVDASGRNCSVRTTNATATSLATGQAPPNYCSWPSTSLEADRWYVLQAPGSVFALSRTMMRGLEDISTQSFELMAEPETVCTVPENIQGIRFPGEYFLRPSPEVLVDWNSSTMFRTSASIADTIRSPLRGRTFSYTPQCSGKGLSLLDTINGVVSGLERVKSRNLTSVSTLTTAARFIVDNADTVAAYAVNATVDRTIFQMVESLENYMDLNMLGLVLGVLAFVLVQFALGLMCASNLGTEQRNVMAILFSMSKAAARASSTAAVTYWRNLRAQQNTAAASQTNEQKLLDGTELEDIGPDESDGEGDRASNLEKLTSAPASKGAAKDTKALVAAAGGEPATSMRGRQRGSVEWERDDGTALMLQSPTEANQRRSSATAVKKAGASDSGNPPPPARVFKVTDKRCFTARIGGCVVLPSLIIAVWIIALAFISAESVNTTIYLTERLHAAMDMSIWILRHTHTCMWAAFDPSTHAFDSVGKSSRQAVLRRMEDERISIESKMALVIHGGQSPITAYFGGIEKGSFSTLLAPLTALPSLQPSSSLYETMANNACPAVLTASARSYYNTGGRSLLTPELCTKAHDGVVARGLSTAISRFLSRSRSLSFALEQLWAFRDSIHGAGRTTLTSSEVATVTSLEFAIQALGGAVLQLSDPWIRLSTRNIAVAVSSDINVAVNNSWALERDVTIIAAVVFVIAGVWVITRGLVASENSIRAARRLLHFLPESAYRDPAVVKALNTAMESLNILVVA